MLYWNTPLYAFDGVYLYPDHADPLQFYYMPAMPHITTLPDSDGKPVPQLQLIKYRGEGEGQNGGFLNFDVNIGIAQDLLDKVASKLQSEAGLSDRPRLAPVPVYDGSVRLIILGKQTGDPAAPPDPDGKPQFVVKIDQAAKPALYGDNQAAFSVALDQYGVTVLEQALQGEMAPIGVIYSLDFLALRPAYAVKINADWDRVQKHLDEHFGVDILIFSAQIDKVVDELIDQRVIVIEADTFIPEGDEENAAVLGRRDQAIQEVRQMVTDTFFKASLEPLDPDETQDNLADALEKLHRASRSPMRVFTYQRTDVTRIDKKVLNVTMNERTTVKRSIYPQGHLGGLFRSLRDDGLDLARFVVPVNLDDPWFERRRLTVISRGDFAADGITSINVHLSYDDEPQNVLLESSTARSDLSWASQVVDGAMVRPVKAQYTVNFAGADGTERPIELTSAEEVVDVEFFEINPRELYAVVPIPVVALGFPFDRYPQVEVHLEYSDTANGIMQQDVVMLDKDHTEGIWKLFARDPRKTGFRYQLILRAIDNRDIEMPWVDTDEERVTIRDPRPNKRTLNIVPNLDFSQVERAFVDVSYADPVNAVFADQSFEFNPTDTSVKTFRVGLVDREKTAISYQATILFKNGGMVIEVPPSVTLDNRIIVRSDMRGHRLLKVRPETIDFGIKRLRQMAVDVRYADDENGLSFAERFFFDKPEEIAIFGYDYVDEHRTAIEYRVDYFYSNGLTRGTDWTPAGGEELVVPAA